MDCKVTDFLQNNVTPASVFDRILQKRQAKVLIFNKEQSFSLLFFHFFLMKQILNKVNYAEGLTEILKKGSGNHETGIILINSCLLYLSFSSFPGTRSRTTDLTGLKKRWINRRSFVTISASPFIS